ncbi:DMT family transporter [Aliiroseovarius subalbicans]|uniref:DMT family transporter n=1 Tax=Aliiroseovarius subalbicans TaxID=2925840 RepID=UPI001F56EC93|nr:DMT family transporter [Aliiroseovarius subalbicans]MCI2400735.1 DMT family transporter [Aliiroseovarius subalbicans]
MTRQPLIAAGLMVAAGAFFALVNTAIQAATMLNGASPPAVTFWQYLIALGFYIPWIYRHRLAVMRTDQVGLHILRVVLAAVGVQLWVMGLAHVPIWQAIALILLSPFFVTTGAGLFLRERVTPERWGAVVLGIAGGAIILEPWSDRFALTALLPVAAAAFWAASSVVTKRLTRVDGPETVTIYLLVLLTPINFALAAGTGFALPAPALWFVVGAGLLTAAAQHVLVKAYSLADAAFLQPFDHLKLPLNVALGFAAFGFAPTGSMWLGTAVILAASFYLLSQESRAGQPA